MYSLECIYLDGSDRKSYYHLLDQFQFLKIVFFILKYWTRPNFRNQVMLKLSRTVHNVTALNYSKKSNFIPQREILSHINGKFKALLRVIFKRCPLTLHSEVELHGSGALTVDCLTHVYTRILFAQFCDVQDRPIYHHSWVLACFYPILGPCVHNVAGVPCGLQRQHHWLPLNASLLLRRHIRKYWLV
jgi:hypothetical protein